MYVEGFRELYRFPGYVVKEARIEEALAVVTLRRDERHGLWCPHCGGRMSPSRESWQTANDLGVGPLPLVLIRYPAIQGRCRVCRRYATVRPPGIGEHQQATERLMAFASNLCRFMPVSRVAELLAVSDAAVRSWDKRVLRRTIGEPDLNGRQILLVDEKSLGRAKPYATVVLDGLSGELLHMHVGGKREGIRGFLRKLTDPQKASIRAVGMDRDGAYRSAVAEYLSADIVYDKFHILQGYNRVIDEVRRREWAKAAAEEKPVIKGLRYILLKRPDRRTAEDAARLRRVIALNENIATVELLKDDLRQLWTYRSKGWARRWLEGWVDWALSTNIQPLKRFARSLRRSCEGVLNYCTQGITSGRLEGFNNIISRAIHRACGIQDLDYLFLKLRQESLA